MDCPSPMTAGRSSLRQFIAATIAVSGLLALVVLQPVSRPDVVAAVSIAAIAVVGWLSGRQPALVGSVMWVAARWMTSADRSGNAAGALAVQWGVMAGLVCWITWLQDRLAAEHRLARLDGLTGLPNRQAFLERCAAELSRTRRFGRPLTLALLDGDGFKEVNDRWGHAAGDRVLQITARTLQETVRQYDFVGRLGGDEFVVLFPETGTIDAQPAVRRLQHALQTQFERQFLPLTYSLGVVTFSTGDGDVLACLRETDRALYLAKQTKRGTACFETAGPASPPQRD